MGLRLFIWSAIRRELHGVKLHKDERISAKVKVVLRFSGLCAPKSEIIRAFSGAVT